MNTLYIIQNSDTKELYIGRTNNLSRRLREHNNGQSVFTNRKVGKWLLVYAEVYRSKIDLDERERKLKQHGSNKRWLKNRIKNSLIKN